MVEATKSYKERMREARAATRAKRETEQAEWRRRIELRCEVRRLALDAVKAGIRARGDKVQVYSRASLQAMANELSGPWLIEQVKAQIAARNLEHLSNSEVPANRRVLLNETHAQNGAVR
jgi:hypothetical protein